MAPSPRPGADAITYEGRRYGLVERGRAAYDAHGEVDLPGGGTLEWADYRTGDERLSFENCDGLGWDASAGRVVAPGGSARRG